MPKVKRLRFYAHPIRDRDIIEWVEQQNSSERSEAIRQAIRRGWDRTDTDKLEAIIRYIIREELRAASFQVKEAKETVPDATAEDPAMSAIIDNLVDWK